MSTLSEVAGSQKRVRKGTHSCVECRRRKRRCIWPSEADKCASCATQGNRCFEQTYRPPSSQKMMTMRQRINQLEEILQQILERKGNIDSALSLDLLELNIADAKKGLRTKLNISAVATAADSSSMSDSSQSTSRPADWTNAPLFGLFDNAVLGHEWEDTLGDVPFKSSRGSLGVMERNTKLLRSLRSLAPSSDAVSLILDESRTPLGILGQIFHDMPGLGTYCLDGSQIDLQHHIVQSFESKDVATVTKVLLCLASCIQQLPANFNLGSAIIPAPLETLQNYYIESAEAFLGPDEGIIGTIDGLECVLAQFRYYLNFGIPRKAWVILRRAIAFAQLLSETHRYPSDSQLKSRKESLCFQIWLVDKCLSLLLGLPYAVHSLPCKIQDISGEDSKTQFFFRLGTIARRVIDRNQQRDNITYADTLKLDLDLQACKNIMPHSWWQFSPDSETPLKEIYERFTTQCWFYNLTNLIHQPFVLKSFTDSDFNPSTVEALASSRAMISCYQTLRDQNRPVLQVCNLMDFEVFTGAMVIMLCQLGGLRGYEEKEREDDRELIYSLIDTFKRVACDVPDDVPTQALRLVESLWVFHDSNSTADTTFHATIPYFGEFRIKKLNETKFRTKGTDSLIAGLDLKKSTEDMTIERAIDFECVDQLYNSPPWSTAAAEWVNGVDFGFQDGWSWDIR